MAIHQAGWLLGGGGQLGMARPYSVDLRERVVRASRAACRVGSAAAKFARAERIGGLEQELLKGSPDRGDIIETGNDSWRLKNRN